MCASMVTNVLGIQQLITYNIIFIDLLFLYFKLFWNNRTTDFYSKDESTNFNAVIANNNDFKPFEYKAKLLDNTVAQPNPNNANGILINATIALLLKYLSNFWISLKLPLINCKVELKRKWTKYCVSSTDGNINNNDSNSITFTIKDTKLYGPVVTLTARYNQKL